MHYQCFNQWMSEQNGVHFADDILTFLHEIISIKIPLKFVPGGSIDDITPSVLVTVWCRMNDKLLPAPIVPLRIKSYGVTRSP